MNSYIYTSVSISTCISMFLSQVLTHGVLNALRWMPFSCPYFVSPFSVLKMDEDYVVLLEFLSDAYTIGKASLEKKKTKVINLNEKLF